MRVAVIHRAAAQAAEAEMLNKHYLPANYRAVDAIGDRVIIVGEDDHGWTLDGYVIPRLASGLYFAEEVK